MDLLSALFLIFNKRSIQILLLWK